VDQKLGKSEKPTIVNF